MYKKLINRLSLGLALLMLISLCVMPNSIAVDEYTLYQGVEDGHTMIGGPDGYYIVYQNPSIANSSLYLNAIDDGVESWNSTYRKTGFSFDYASESDATHYNNSKLRFVVSNYGENFRGHTIRYSASGYDTIYEIPSYGPASNWAYAIIRINNEIIESNDRTYAGESGYTKRKGIQSTAAHEIGHALGLDHHISDPPVLMNTSFKDRSIDGHVYSPESGDIAGVREIYVTGISTNNNASASTQAVTPPKQSLADFTAERDRVAVASFRGYGDIVARGNGVINLGGHIMDDTAYLSV